jgi:hypothetical protein
VHLDLAKVVDRGYMTELIYEKMAQLNGCKEQALETALKYRMFRTFIKLCYDIGSPQTFTRLVAEVKRHQVPIQFALQTVHDCDMQAVQSSIGESVSTHSEQYKGCKIFEIFEKDHMDDLGQFLRLTSAGLYTIWQLRYAPNSLAASQPLALAEKA